MTTIAAQSNECMTPVEEGQINLKNYEVIPENIIQVVNEEQVKRIKHQKLVSGFGVIGSKDKDFKITNAASSMMSS